MYMTFSAPSPCAKMVSFPSNLLTVLRRPAESRNNCTSNAGIMECAFLGERETLTETRRGAVDTMRQNNMQADPAGCSILHTLGRPPKRSQAATELQQVLRIPGVTGDS